MQPPPRRGGARRTRGAARRGAWEVAQSSGCGVRNRNAPPPLTRAPPPAPRQALESCIHGGGGAFHDYLEIKDVPKARGCAFASVSARRRPTVPPPPRCSRLLSSHFAEFRFPRRAAQALTNLALREDLPSSLRGRAEKMVHAWSSTLFLNGSEAELSAQGMGRESRSGLLTADDLRAERNAASALAASAASEAAVRAAAGVYVAGMGVSAAANTARVASRRPQGVATKYGVLRESVEPDARGDWD